MIMDAQKEKKRVVCVTGASGYVASWLVKRLLEHGYYVRGTVRDPGITKQKYIISCASSTYLYN